jgi:hypothetical protein
MSKKALGIGFGAVAAAGIAAMVATGFIHEEKAPTPDECTQALIKDAAKIPNDGTSSAVVLAGTPEAKQANAKFQDCMTRAADAKSGWTISFGWK